MTRSRLYHIVRAGPGRILVAAPAHHLPAPRARGSGLRRVEGSGSGLRRVEGMSDQQADRQAIRDLIESWVVWRDAGDWERFRTVWHDDGRMMATWFQGSADEFIRVSREGFERGVRILHFLGGSSIDLNGSRAFAQTKMTINQRAPIHDVLCDVVCTGRFCDFLERRDGRWGIVLRQ